MSYAVYVIFLALIFYTIGVWAEKFQKDLKPWHVVLFWVGLLCDTIGTTAMGDVLAAVMKGDFHGLTGFIAILLMFFHAFWATWVIYKNKAKAKVNFHKFSIVVWIIWLIPMFSPVFLGMGQ